MINNIRFKMIDGKINKIPEFYTIFARNKCQIRVVEGNLDNVRLLCFISQGPVRLG